MKPIVPFLLLLLLLASCRSARTYDAGARISMPEIAPKVTVFANRGWQDTGLFANIGDRIAFQADGIWSLHNREQTCNANGIEYTTFGVTLPKRNPLPREPHGMLIARIGETQPFPIGTETEMISSGFGKIYLRANDSSPGDNVGALSVAIDIIEASARNLRSY